MTTHYKSMITIFIEQQQRRDNYIAASELGLFTAKNLDVYHERIEKITKQEVKAVNQCVNAMRRGRNG